MGDKNEGDHEFMLPGFRFHPTDEELVSFYLKRKVQQRPLSVELIRQLDIYKYDPWDLPKFATTGEKEWYFYCQRDRKYRNSTRPNRVTDAGFWKATGTDRPIYSSDGNKCIGLKKSLVFYRGRAAKGVKTDWMMHEFRLPSLSDPSAASPKRFFHNADSWAICRIFKKTNPTALRALSQSFVSSLPPETARDTRNRNPSNSTQSYPDKILKATSYNQFRHENTDTAHQKPYSDDTNATNNSANPFSYLDFTSYNQPSNVTNSLPFPDQQDLKSLLLAPQETQLQFPKFTWNDISSFLLNTSSDSSVFEGFSNQIDPSINFGEVMAHDQCPPLVSLPQEYQKNGFEENVHMKNTRGVDGDGCQYQTLGHMGFTLGDFTESVTDEDHQGLKQRMLLDCSYPLLSSSISGELPSCFSITKCFT